MTSILFKATKGDPKQSTLDTIATRFTLPVRNVAFNAFGSALAAGADDGEVKMISLQDMSAKSFRGHDGAIRSVSFDPENDMLCTASTDGTVRIWSIKEATCIKTLPILNRGQDDTYVLDWHPNGKLIAIPIKNQVHVYERDSWDQLYVFGGDEGHSQEVTMAVWSPNGEYLASVSASGEIIVWSTMERQTLGRFKHKDKIPISCVSWHPKGNEIAWADTHGKFGVWKEPVPEASQFALPTGGGEVAEAEQAAQNLANLFPDDDDDEVGVKRKRLRKAKAKKVADDDSDDENNGIETSAVQDADPMSDNESEINYGKTALQEVALQAPFQPSSTPIDGTRRILVWNNVGIITSREGELENSVDVEFHDVQKHKPWRMKDNHGFTMGTLSEQCIVMATPNRTHISEHQRNGAELSTLFCKILDHWATDETWHLTFPGDEEIEGVAAGEGVTGFVAVTTSKNHVRLYSITGVPKHIISLEGPSISIAAKDAQLFIAYHQAAVPGSQCFGYMLLDVDNRKMLSKDRLPVSNGAELGWIGFTDDGIPAVADTEEVVRALLHEWGYTWTPIIEMKTLAKSPSDSHWIVGIADNEITSIVCKGGQTYPPVLPRPIPSNFSLRIPVVSGAQSVAHEESFLRSKIMHEHVCRIEGLNFADPEDRSLIVQQQRRMDLHIIRCIDQAIKNNRPGRALDLATYLTAVKSIDGSIKLAAHRKMQLLAERMMLVKQSLVTQQQQSMVVMRAQSMMRTPPMSAQRVPSKRSWQSDGDDSLEILRTTPGITPSRNNQKSLRQAPRESDEDSDSDSTSPIGQSFSSQNPITSKTVPERSSRSPVKKLKPSKSGNPFAKPSNPFAKSSESRTQSTPISELGRADEQSNESANVDAKKRATPSFLMQASSQPRKKTKTVDPNAPKKPMSAYMLWLAANRNQLKAENPGIANTEILKKAGEKWNSLGDEGKATWNDEHAKQKDIYMKKLEAYQATLEETSKTAKSEVSLDEEQVGQNSETPTEAPKSTRANPFAEKSEVPDHQAASQSQDERRSPPPSAADVSE